ncbi:unnamed protein product, partial [Didymodactylos carnosus]
LNPDSSTFFQLPIDLIAASLNITTAQARSLRDHLPAAPLQTVASCRVYGIPCMCADMYVDETWSFKRRIKEHFKKLQQRDAKGSELAQHHENGTACFTDFENSMIFDKEKNWNRRKTLETVYTIANLGYNRCKQISPQWKSTIKQWIEPRSGEPFFPETE